MAKHNNSAERYRYEYVKHLQKNAFPILLYLFTFMMISAMVTICAVAIVNPLTKNINNLRKLNYDYVIESQSMISEFRQNYKLDNLVTFLNADKRINVNTYLSSDTNNAVLSFDDALEANEVAISKQIADKLRVREGEQLQIALPIYDSPSTYYVKKIIPYISDYYEIDKNKDFAVAFLGYDKKIESHTSGKYVYFLTDSESKHFAQSSIDYNQKYYVRGELDSLNNKANIYTAIILGAFLIIICIYNVIISKLIKNEVSRYLNDCFPLKVVKWYYMADHLIYSAIPLLLICVLSIILNVSLYCIIGYACISGLWIIWWLTGVRCYEKAA